MKKGKIVFTGKPVEFYFQALGLLILTVLTSGILLPYFIYWSYKYFASHSEIEF